MRTCKCCGAKNADNARACARCGKPMAPRGAKTNAGTRAAASKPSASGSRKAASGKRKRAKKRGANPRLIALLAAVILALVAAIVAVKLLNRGQSPAEPSPTATEAAIPTAAPEAGDAFDALSAYDGDDAVTVYSASGDARDVTEDDARDYVIAALRQALPNCEADAVYYEGMWSVDLTYSLSADDLLALEALTDDAVAERWRGDAQTALDVAAVRTGTEPEIAANAVDAETGNLSIRVVYPGDSLGDAASEPPEVTRFDGEADIFGFEDPDADSIEDGGFSFDDGGDAAGVDWGSPGEGWDDGAVWDDSGDWDGASFPEADDAWDESAWQEPAA